MMMAQRFVTPVALVALVLATTACDVAGVVAQTSAEATFERTLTVTGPVELDVRTGSGDIGVRVGTGDRVLVLGRVRGSSSAFDDDVNERVRRVQSQPPIEQNGNVIRIGHTRDNPLYQNIRITYEITVPAATRLTARSGSGDQLIASINGPVEARTGSGDIRIAQTDADVTASTGSGDVEIERAGGRLNAETGSGDIQVRSVTGAVRARTGSGDIDIAQLTRAEVDARTGSGDVRLGVAENAAFTLAARTGSGRIQTTHPLLVSGEISRRALNGTVRGGGPRVEVTTGSGSITIQ
jgi:hypothetical protein